MFEKLAKVRAFELWLTMPQREAARSRLVPCNDNRPRPDILHPRHSRASRLACRWSLSRDGRLTCRWELEADGSNDGQRSASAADPQFVRSGDPMNLLRAVAG